jgi:hypothetical protein
MSFFCRLSGRHYWCTPHRSSDKRLIQVCYECGAERSARELVDDLAPERLNHSLAAARSQLANASGRVADDSRNRDQVAAQGRPRKFALVK